LLRDLAVEECGLSCLKVNPRNARTHSGQQIEAIAASIEAFGFANPILIDDGDMILAGHGRVQAAKLIGLDRVPTIRISGLTEPQKRAFVLAENRLAERAGWDRELLSLELGELSTLLPDLGLKVDLTGFEVGEIDLILNAAEEKGAGRSIDTDDDWPAAPATPVSQPGDLWVAGGHRLLCGDPQDQAEVFRLLGEQRADFVFADPPDNLSAAPDARGGGVPQYPELVGNPSDASSVASMRVILGNAAAASRGGALQYLCVRPPRMHDLLTAGRSAYGELKDLIVWVKDKAGPGQLYRSQHELIAVFQVGGSKFIGAIEPRSMQRNRSNVWKFPGGKRRGAAGSNKVEIGPPFKPIKLITDAIEDATCPGAVVLDLFGGSGTTLLAAERTGRRALILEKGPQYVDLAIARFERVSRTDVIHADTGKTYAEIAGERCSQFVQRQFQEKVQ